MYVPSKPWQSLLKTHPRIPQSQSTRRSSKIPGKPFFGRKTKKEITGMQRNLATRNSNNHMHNTGTHMTHHTSARSYIQGSSTCTKRKNGATRFSQTKSYSGEARVQLLPHGVVAGLLEAPEGEKELSSSPAVRAGSEQGVGSIAAGSAQPVWTSDRRGKNRNIK
jgi:hypothetical protein